MHVSSDTRVTGPGRERRLTFRAWPQLDIPISVTENRSLIQSLALICIKRDFQLWSHNKWPSILALITLHKFQLIFSSACMHCKKGKVVSPQFGYISFLLSACIVEHIGVPLPALDSTQIKNLIWLSRTLANVIGEYFANEIVQSCGKGYETEVTKMG